MLPWARKLGYQVLLTALALLPAGAAPPPAEVLAPADFARERLLADQSRRAQQEGDFAAALARERERLALLSRLRGADHWQTSEAREAALRLELLPAGDAGRAARLGRARRLQAEAGRLEARLQTAAAEKPLRQALALVVEAVGEGHAETAHLRDALATNLGNQGRHADAAPVFERALADRRKAHPAGHPLVAISCNNLAINRNALARPTEARALHAEALAIREKALPPDHPSVAQSCANLARTLDILNRPAEALPLHERALVIRRRCYGEWHLDTAFSYANLAGHFAPQGRYAEARPLLEKALAIRRGLLPPDHPDLTLSYANLARALDELGRVDAARALHESALATRRRVLGDDHPETAVSYNNLANNLSLLGRDAEARVLAEKALAIWRAAFTDSHPVTATGYGNMAALLDGQGCHAEAQPLHERSLAIRQKVLPADSPALAESYEGIGLNLAFQGKDAEARPWLEKSLALRRKVLPPDHPRLATSLTTLAYCLQGLGASADAVTACEQAMTVHARGGPDHPLTALARHRLAAALDQDGRAADAALVHEQAIKALQASLGDGHPLLGTAQAALGRNRYRRGDLDGARVALEAALPGLEAARLESNATGFDRARYSSQRGFGPALLAALHARQGRPLDAWRHAETVLARGLLDDLARVGPGSEADNPTLDNPACRAGPASWVSKLEVERLDRQLLPLLGRPGLPPEQAALRDELVARRRGVLAGLSRAAADRSAALLLPLDRVQAGLAPDDALVFWLDVEQEHLACVVRRTGPPHWVRLAGSGPDGRWTGADTGLPRELRQALVEPGRDAPDRQVAALRRQRIEPLLPTLKADADRPAVRRLLAVPAGALAGIPIDLLAPEFTVSHVPSGSVLGRLAAAHRPLARFAGGAEWLLALGDPAFGPAGPPPPAPPAGVLVRRVAPGSPAYQAGLRAGDVLTRAAGSPVADDADLRAALARVPVTLAWWRDGVAGSGELRSLPPGFVLDARPAPEAVRAWRAAVGPVVRGDAGEPLPGTRAEVEALARLVGPERATLMVGSLASRQQLDRIIGAGRLPAYRLVHFATHGRVDWAEPGRSALLLARDRLPGADVVARGGRGDDGWLRVRDVLRDWQLDADLVTLSACQTGLGPDGGGEGLIGFSQAFLQKGARAVLLSLWKVDDVATSLLMLRFYENALGRRPGLKAPLGRAEALAEAKAWLRGLSEAEIKAALDATLRLRGAKVTRSRPALEGRPFAHPFYWAAFVLVGDPD